MPRLDWQIALKAFGGFLAGLALWLLLSPLYNGLVARGAEAVLRTFERPAVTHLRTVETDDSIVVDRSDFDPRSKRPVLAIEDLTFNVILLCALFAIGPATFSDRNIRGFLLAMVLLIPTHILGAVTEVMSLYVLKLGPWSRVHYSDLERNVWSVANHFYRLVLMYAIAFGLWWLCRPQAAAAPARAARKKRRK
ncbi:MAG TPA: exosortase H-associated membrane protein [Thermoanaerobaculia bacterium]|nr:exosortase H-associated membrane protein [Thermoanaerobaculia bacterium]